MEIEFVETIVKNLLSKDGYLNLPAMDSRIAASQKALVSLKEKLIVLRKKTLEYNWNYVNPNEDYGNCLMKFSRASTDRAKLNDQFWGTSYITPEEKWRGLPYEVIVALINKTKSNVWVNIPHNASINYVKDMANYFKEHLNKDSTIFLELSNEVWNGGFAGQKYFTGLAKHRYEYYVNSFLDQFEEYLKTSKDEVVAYRNFGKDYLDYFYHYKKEITQELDNLKSCKKQSDYALLVKGIKLTDNGLNIGAMITHGTSRDNQAFSTLPKEILLTKQGLAIDKIIQLDTTSENPLDCKTQVENDYIGNDAFIKKIQLTRMFHAKLLFLKN